MQTSSMCVASNASLFCVVNVTFHYMDPKHPRPSKMIKMCLRLPHINESGFVRSAKKPNAPFTATTANNISAWPATVVCTRKGPDKSISARQSKGLLI